MDEQGILPAPIVASRSAIDRTDPDLGRSASWQCDW
jgi:hypothetical protein